MIKVLMIAAVALALTACKDDKGLKVGLTLQDCPAIAANMRQDAALAVKGLSRDDAVKALAAKFMVTEADAALCLK